MRNVIAYYVYAENQLKLSTIDEAEAHDYMKMYFDFNGIRCEMESVELTPVDHTTSKK